MSKKHRELEAPELYTGDLSFSLMLGEQRIVHFDWRVQSGQWQEGIWLEIYSEDILWKAWVSG